MADDGGRHAASVVSPESKKRTIASGSFITSSPMNPSAKKLRARAAVGTGKLRYLSSLTMGAIMQTCRRCEWLCRSIWHPGAANASGIAFAVHELRCCTPGLPPPARTTRRPRGNRVLPVRILPLTA